MLPRRTCANHESVHDVLAQCMSPGIKNDRISCSTACGTAHIRLHIREADMRRPLRISARGDTQLIVHFLKREREPK